MRHNPIVTLRHMDNLIISIRSFVVGMGARDFLIIDELNDMAFRAVKNCFTEIGECVNRIMKSSKYICQRNPSVNWSKIISMRNRIVHDFEKVSKSILWETINGGPLDELERVIQNEINSHMN